MAGDAALRDGRHHPARDRVDDPERVVALVGDEQQAARRGRGVDAHSGRGQRDQDDGSPVVACVPPLSVEPEYRIT